MFKITCTLFVGFLTLSTAAAQDFNYVPGWANTYNHSRVGQPADPSEIEPCRFSMLAQSERRRLHELAHAKIAEVGMEAALPWIDAQSEASIARMVAEGLCRGN